jgi:hypothetical protein
MTRKNVWPDHASLADFDHGKLSALWVDLLGHPPPVRASTAFMRRILAFELQAKRSGGVSVTTRRKLKGVLKDKRRDTPPWLEPGGQLIREWNGRRHVIDVEAGQFRWNGDTYRSLSAIAKAITGTHWSGPRFFGLKDRVGS